MVVAQMLGSYWVDAAAHSTSGPGRLKTETVLLRCLGLDAHAPVVGMCLDERWLHGSECSSRVGRLSTVCDGQLYYARLAYLCLGSDI